MTETAKYMNTFMIHLNKNKMGSTFRKLVTSSLDRRGFKSKRYEQGRVTRRDGHHVFKSEERNKRVSTEFNSERDQLMDTFRIKDSPLGHSIRVIDSPRKSQSKSIHDQIRQTRESPRKGLGNSMKRSMVRDKSQKFNSLILNRKQQALQQFLSRRSQLLKLNRVDLILSTLTGNSSLANLRIYKEPLKKFYSIRYVKEKITSFFDYEYIEDYDSQIRILQSLLSFKLDEIYFLCFLMLDVNCDGLLCNHDLFNTATASGRENPLISKDVYKIFQYVSYYRKMSPSISINDSVCDGEQFRAQNSNIQKYRLLETRKEKEKEKTRRLFQESQRLGIKKSFILDSTMAKEGKKVIMTRKTNTHLFSFRKEDQEGQTAMKELRKRFAATPLESKSNMTFRVNFNTFKTIFNNSIPDTYFDVLYVQGGIKLPQKTYMPLDFVIGDKNQKASLNTSGNRIDDLQNKVSFMKKTFNQSRVDKISNESKFWKSLFS